MELEDALNQGLPAYQVERIASGDQFRADLAGYPQCSGFGPTPEEAVRVARHLYTQLRDGQAAATVCDMQDELSGRLREAARRVVARTLIGKS
jgi:hypothetical protein